ncbi:MAG: PD-(D/E)XK nuclease family protein [Candidatus Thermoplasmatota archaeon]|nr:PD-(D/E)XK nuclease family protein [Candidatus Thermoplasmatota archaeon]
MKVYSHSRLSCFEQCPYKFKLKYLDKVETEVEQSVEAFLGSRVHDALEKLYRDLEFHKVNSLDELLTFLRGEWEKQWSDDIIIVKEEYGKTNYLSMAEQYISDYYHRYEPFDQGRTISIEDRIVIDLDGTSEYKLQGFIDRLVEVKDGYYEVHDYKTNSRLPLPEYIETDRQLALYAIGVKERYPDCQDVRLVWHFLKFDKEIDSTRTNEELEQLKKDTVALIDTIEQAETFPCHPSALCDWCEFKPLCKQWAHLYKIREKPEREYLNDSGVQLVNRYAELKKKKSQMNHELSSEMEQIEEALAHFAEKEQVDVIFGSDKRVRITKYERFSFPSKNSKNRKQLVNVLKEQGKWEEVNQLDTAALNKIILKKEWDEDILSMLEEYTSLETSKRFYLGSIKK